MTKIFYLIFFILISGSGQEIIPGPSFIIKISDDAAREIEENTGVIHDSILLSRINSVALDVMRASDLRTIFECKILKTDMINAFALPAGPIYVTMGLVVLLDSLKTEESQSMFAGILGHELAHICLRHSVAMLRLENFIKKGNSSIPEDVAQVLQKGYTREQEFEADEYGVLYAMRAGYDFESIIRFYKKIRELYGETPPGDEKYNDHPRTTERIARLYEVRAQLERDFDQWYFGVEALNEGRYDDAIKHFKLFTTTFSNSAWGWTNLATAYLFEAMSKMESLPVLFMTVYYTEPDFRLRGEPEELSYAEEAFKKAIDVDTAYNIVYHGNMGIMYALRGKFEKAAEFTKKALEANQVQHFFYNNLGNIFFLQKDYKSAEDMYKKAIDINSNWPMPKYNLAMTYESMGKNKEAIGLWKELLEVSGYNQVAVKHLSRLDKKFKPEKIEIEPEKKIAEITIGMPEDSVINKLGVPSEKVALEKLLALEYSEKKLVIFLRNGKVSGILARNGSEEKTSKGIGIGSSISELCKFYGLPDDIVQQKDCEQWIYCKYGLLFNIYQGTVSQFQIVEVSKDG
ncbi:MAG: M48 family metalloprotease [candidate division WOR-3 bacterium]|nr:M48 family metalloprotease [candidate division WOR-3 bacterium]